jgi:enediyne biosynthesis protein E4
LLAAREIAVGYGYASGQPAEAQFGLGSANRVDIEVILPHGRGKITRRDVAGNQKVVLRQ